MNWFILGFFIVILASLAIALYFMMRRTNQDDAIQGKRMVHALAIRIGFSIALFLLLLTAYYMDWIQPTGIRPGQ